MPGSQVSQASQELRQTLIPCPGGYVALPELESCIARRRSLANEQPHQAEQRATASQAKVPVARLGHSQQAIASAARPAASKRLCVRIHCIPDFVSAFTAFRTSCPHLLLSRLRVHIHCIPDFVSASTVLRTSCPHSLMQIVAPLQGI
ncbi:hypothetical protein CRG98_014669 [Punica granatum]|uniref:Uncharacterized protein n=1 Tax=Punica granatum TaxID=22663 RepID=A0A2I0K8Q2_PUNGR|nr:hypothetical protein CRG98_014669 [Punica granatum]